MSSKRKVLHPTTGAAQDETESPVPKRRKYAVSAFDSNRKIVCIRMAISFVWLRKLVRVAEGWRLKLGAKDDAGFEGLGRVFCACFTPRATEPH